MVERETESVYENEESVKEFSVEEKAIVSLPTEELPLIQKDESEVAKAMEKTKDRDVALAQVEMEKKLALIKAWEDNEKAKADNKAYKKLSALDAWESTKRASLEAQLKQIEEKFEKKKAEYGEKMKNKMSIVHRAAEENKASIEADRAGEFLTVEEVASKFRATGRIPKKLFACFSSF
ncbi:hypothetical protein ABFS82_05G101600 [Erythranthe guttata]|uniref:remorin-like n=1 Tax=Erythranthe guttata TaxID=4155 RepID=UPI00064DDB1B|nr:PREDICTED: remorin-like [Erythranthe guttata]|eukprot:XP_012836260.1 PREDICTED: remorin-like [Erythranthe guttata]